MRYIGNKENILDKIYSILKDNGVKGESFFDFFSGTTNVARYFKRMGYMLYSSDLLYLSYCLQRAYIENNEQPQFLKLFSQITLNVNTHIFATPMDVVIEYLDGLLPINGFIFNNYTPGGTKNLPKPRMYFTDENGKKIDAIRTQIEIWNNDGLLTQSEYFILLASLLETVPFYANISGVYAAFHKKWDPRALKLLRLRSIEIINSDYDNKAFYGNSIDLCPIINVDILYLDPPYNERQYAPNYHIMETIAKYDNPEIKGVTGMRNYDNQKSAFCNVTTALKELDYICKTAKYKYFVLSYNSEGIMAQEQIIAILNKYGKTSLSEFEHVRFKSNSNGLSRSKKHIYEQLYIMKHNED